MQLKIMVLFTWIVFFKLDVFLLCIFKLVARKYAANPPILFQPDIMHKIHALNALYVFEIITLFKVECFGACFKY